MNQQTQPRLLRQRGPRVTANSVRISPPGKIMRVSSDLVKKFLDDVPLRTIPTQYLNAEVNLSKGLILLRLQKTKTSRVRQYEALKVWHNSSRAMFCAVKGLLQELGLDPMASIGVYKATATPGLLTVYMRQRLEDPTKAA